MRARVQAGNGERQRRTIELHATQLKFPGHVVGTALVYMLSTGALVALGRPAHAPTDQATTHE